MKWLLNFLRSSIGLKVTISLTGLFLCSFLLIHLIGNLQLLAGDGGAAFNEYAYFMTHNPLIKTISYGLYASILYHALMGLYIALTNRKARGGTGYAGKTGASSSWTSRNMALLGTIILAFVVIHMKQFWFEMHWGEMPMMADGETKDLYQIVLAAFKDPLYVGIYVFSMLAIALHLSHGFQSGFQTLGLRHEKYTPLIKGFGLIFAIAIPLAFAAIPLVMFFLH